MKSIPHRPKLEHAHILTQLTFVDEGCVDALSDPGITERL